MEQAGGILCRNHVAEAFFFALQLEQEFAQAVGLGLMGFGRFGPREGRDAAQDLRFPGCCARPDGILNHQFLTRRAVGVAASFGRQGPCGKLAFPGGVLVKEKISASGLQIEEQGGLFVGREQREGTAQGRRDDRPVPPAVAFTGFGPVRGIGPCRNFRLRRRVEKQRGAFPQIERKPAFGIGVDAKVKAAPHPVGQHVDDPAIRKVFAQPHDIGRRCAADGDFVRRKEKEGSLAARAKKQETFAACAVEREQGHILGRAVDFFDPATHERRRKLVAQATEHMAVHAKPREFGRRAGPPMRKSPPKRELWRAVELLAPNIFPFFLTGLAVDAKLGHGTGLETGNADIFTAVFADAVGPFVQPLDGGLDLADQAAFAVTDAQCESAIRFGGRPVGRISEELVAVGEVLQRGISLVLRLFKHIVEERTKIFDVLLFQETTSWQSSRCGLNRIKLV